MLDSTAPIPLDYRLPDDAYYHLVRTLRVTLPPPLTGDPAALLHRDHAAIARIAGLAPGNSAEVDFAAQYVAASEQWKDCLRLVQAPGTTPEWAAKYRAQAASMMREANSAMRLLLLMQATRRKLEADNTLCDRAARTEHVATYAMAEALDAIRAEPTGPAPAATSTSSPVPSSFQAPSSSPLEARARRAPTPGAERAAASAPEPQPEPAEELQPDAVAEAEQYAAIYPERAALIRRLGRVPDNVSFGPPDDDIVAALVTASTPTLSALDRTVPESRAA